MQKKISIAIDAMGGDDAPNKTLGGVKLFLEKNKNENDYVLHLFGKEKIINTKIEIFYNYKIILKPFIVCIFQLL